MRENENSINKDGFRNSPPKKETMIFGDSMIKHVNGGEVSTNDSVKIGCHLGATTDEIIDYVRPTALKKTDMIIIHTGTNDIQNIVNILQKVRKFITTIKSMLTMKYKLLFQVSFTVMIKISRKKLKKSTESCRIYARVKGLSSLIIILLMVHALIEANYT